MKMFVPYFNRKPDKCHLIKFCGFLPFVTKTTTDNNGNASGASYNLIKPTNATILKPQMHPINHETINTEHHQ
jgi:hypothetical protein